MGFSPGGRPESCTGAKARTKSRLTRR